MKIISGANFSFLGWQLETCRFKDLEQDFPPHFHGHYLVGCLTCGQRKLHLGRQTIILGPMQLVGLNPGQPHACSKHGAEKNCWHALHIPTTFMAEIFNAQHNSQTLPQFRHTVFVEKTHTQNFFKIVQAYEADRDQDRLRNTLRIFLKELVALPPNASRKNSAFPIVFEDLCAWMRAHCSENISLDNMAKWTAMDKYSLLRQFRRLKGITPYRYLENLRLESARTRLLAGATLIEAAIDSGFHDQSHFQHCFKKNFGFTPGQFRRACICLHEENIN